MLCAIWYHLYNLKNVKNTHGGVLLLVKLQALACKFAKSDSAWMFFAFFYIVKMVRNRAKRLMFGNLAIILVGYV